MEQFHTDPPVVVTLWETYGADMQAVADALAAATGLAAHTQAYSSEDIESGVEEREKEGGLGVLLRSLVPGFIAEGGDPTMTLAAADSGYRDMAENSARLVEQQASVGGIIMGRGAQFLLADRPNTLRVKLDGRVPDRVRNAARRDSIDETRAAKRQKIEDGFRADLSRRVHGFDPRDNDHYDLVLDGPGLGPAACADIIVAAVRAKLGTGR